MRAYLQTTAQSLLCLRWCVSDVSVQKGRIWRRNLHSFSQQRPPR